MATPITDAPMPAPIVIPPIITPGNQTSEYKFAVWGRVVSASLMGAAMALSAIWPHSIYLSIVVAILAPLADHFGAKTQSDNRTALKIAALKANVDHAAIEAGIGVNSLSDTANALSTAKEEVEKKP